MSAQNAAGMSRRRFLAASAAGLGAASVAGLAASGAGSRAQAARTGAASLDVADAVLDAFQTHRLVGLGEMHGLQNHHDVLDMLLSDPRVPEVVDDIVIEFGNALYQPTIDRFIAGQPVDNADLRPVWRNTTQSPDETWDEPVYEQFFRTVRAVNWTLPPTKQVRVLAGDPPIDWPKVTKPSELLTLLRQRDTHAASVIEKHVLDKGHRALVCYGINHLLHWLTSKPFSNSLANIIERQTGERIYTIADIVPFKGDPGGLARGLLPYSRNTLIPTAGTWLGSFDAGLVDPVIYAIPHRKATNLYCGVPLGSLIDAGLYIGQPETLTASWWNPAIYLDPAYWKELQRRNAIADTGLDLDSYRKEQPARYQQGGMLPRAFACGNA